MRKDVTGFLVAPIFGSAVPVMVHALVLPSFETTSEHLRSTAPSLFAAIYLYVCALNYLLTVVLAIPAFMFLRHLGRANLTSSLATGLFLGALVGVVLFAAASSSKWGVPEVDPLRIIVDLAVYGVFGGLATAYSFWHIALRNG